MFYPPEGGTVDWEIEVPLNPMLDLFASLNCKRVHNRDGLTITYHGNVAMRGPNNTNELDKFMGILAPGETRRTLALMTFRWFEGWLDLDDFDVSCMYPSHGVREEQIFQLSMGILSNNGPSSLEQRISLVINDACVACWHEYCKNERAARWQ